jgi:two-component system phosphate regulon sensor histidine kinase PhoR
LSQGFRTEIKLILVVFSTALAIGFAMDQIALMLLLASWIFIFLCYKNLLKLVRWLNRDNNDVPETSGLWGEVFDSIYHRQRRHNDEKAQLQGVVSRIQNMTSTLREGVIVIDSRGYLDFWNPAAHRMLTLNSKDRGQSIINFIRHPRFVTYLEQEDYSQPIELPSPRLSFKRLELSITPFGNNERLILVRDVTQLHNLETMRQEFVANVSHEMRTPLTVISGYIETLADSNTQPAWHKPLAQVQQQATRLTMLVNDLLVLSKLETSSPEKNHANINITVLLKTIKDEATILSQDKNQELRLNLGQGSEQLSIYGDEKELHSAISNLTTNAIKYTQEGGCICIDLAQDKDHFTITVSDNGPGISAQHLPRLTERFYRVESSRNRSRGGTGLGLAIVKHVLMRHNASLSITSELDKGSVFTCRFDLD